MWGRTARTRLRSSARACHRASPPTTEGGPSKLIPVMCTQTHENVENLDRPLSPLQSVNAQTARGRRTRGEEARRGDISCVAAAGLTQLALVVPKLCTEEPQGAAQTLSQRQDALCCGGITHVPGSDSLKEIEMPALEGSCAPPSSQLPRRKARTGQGGAAI